VQHLRAIVDMKPTAPFGIMARAQLKLGQTLDRLGQRDDALRAYRAAIDSAPPGDPDRVVRAARDGLRSR
jgi:hypothetical protein